MISQASFDLWCMAAFAAVVATLFGTFWRANIPDRKARGETLHSLRYQRDLRDKHNRLPPLR